MRRLRLEYLALAVLLFAFLGFFATRVWDIDFWWHIAAGKNILETVAIPKVDPFGMYDAANACGQTVLKSEWLGQVWLYAIFRWFGLDGIILLRAGILVLCLVMVYVRCRLVADDNRFALIVTSLAGLAILHHTGERPQLFSFLLLSLLFLLLDGFTRSGSRWMLFAIPPLMLLWSNIHAGALMGAGALGLFGIGYLLERRLSGAQTGSSQILPMVAVVTLACLTLLIAPSGLDTFKCILLQQTGTIRETVSEYASPWSLWPVTFWYWVFFAVTLIGLPGLLGKPYLKQAALVLVLGLFSLLGFRYIPMFVLAVAPYVAASLHRMSRRFRWSSAVMQLSVLFVALACTGYGLNQGKMFQRGLQEQRFPVGAVSFIKAHGLGGRMFNGMNWGGYLLWNLHDATTLFIDGRTLDPYRVVPYTNILWATPEGLRYFEQARFDLVLIPYRNSFGGKQYPVIAYLKHNPAWQVVYQDQTGYLFARRDVPPGGSEHVQ